MFYQIGQFVNVAQFGSDGLTGQSDFRIELHLGQVQPNSQILVLYDGQPKEGDDEQDDISSSFFHSYGQLTKNIASVKTY